MFIKLTLYDGRPILFNVGDIETVYAPVPGSRIETSKYKCAALVDIHRDGGRPASTHDVRETVDEVYALIHEALG